MAACWRPNTTALKSSLSPCYSTAVHVTVEPVVVVFFGGFFYYVTGLLSKGHMDFTVNNVRENSKTVPDRFMPRLKDVSCLACINQGWQMSWFNLSSHCLSQSFTIKSQRLTTSVLKLYRLIVKPWPECSHCACGKKQSALACVASLLTFGNCLWETRQEVCALLIAKAFKRKKEKKHLQATWKTWTVLYCPFCRENWRTSTIVNLIANDSYDKVCCALTTRWALSHQAPCLLPCALRIRCRRWGIC